MRDEVIMRIFTTQVGEYANWVGAHYWSSLEYDPSNRKSDSPLTDALYNESIRGEKIPRMFLVDSATSLGSCLPVETSVEEVEGFRVEKIIQDVADVEQNGEVRYWTDIWELRQLPEHRLILPFSESPTGNSYRFWFEYEKWSQEKIDETQIRKLVEETDCGVDTLKMLIDTGNSQCGLASSFSEYLGACYPKASVLSLMSPLPDYSQANSDVSMASMINLLNYIVTEKRRTEELISSMIVVPPHRNHARLLTSAQGALWLDSTCLSRLEGRFSVEYPYLSVDGSDLLSAKTSCGAFPLMDRERSFFKNAGSPIPAQLSSKIVAGTLEAKACLGMLEKSVEIIGKFTRDFQAAWEPHSDLVERDDLRDAADTLQGMVNSLRDPMDED